MFVLAMWQHTQSGAIGIGMMGKTVTENIASCYLVGNKSDISEADRWNICAQSRPILF
jgi:hypothetical protein